MQLSTLKANLSGLREGLGGQAEQGQGGLAGSILFGNLGAAGVMAAVSLVTSGIQKMTGTVQSAAKSQTLGLAQAGDLSSQLGINFGRAKELVQDTRIEISKMAAALPGENAEYNAINSQISATVAGYSKGNIDKFREDSLELTKRFGVLASIRGVDANMGGSALNRVLAGSMSIGEAFGTNDIFQKNPLLRKFIDEQLKIIGKSDADWKSLTTETRAKILKVAARQAVADETIAEFDGTVESMIALANTNLFDTDIGLFGFLRKLGSAGGRSGLDAVQGFMTNLGTLFNSLGILKGNEIFGFDPMSGIIATLDWFTDLTNTVTGTLEGGKASDITKYISNLFVNLFNGLNNTLKGTGNAIKAVNWGELGKQLGFLTGQLFTMLFTRVDWGTVTVGILKALYGLGDFIGGFILGAIQGNLDELGSAIKRLFDYITNWVGNIIPNVGVTVKTGVNRVTTDPLGALGGVVGRLNPLGDNGLLGALKSGGGIIGNVLNPSDTKSTPVEPVVTPGLPLPSVPIAKETKQSFAPTINVPVQNGNPQENAQAMLQALNQAYVQYQQNSLA
ncbi:MAG: hypothetical protein KME59_21320 [Trichormus sp. ATA11-4-KO1]|nr:hypothetical protein [Trichormus sp. ATA11-4-KO1]